LAALGTITTAYSGAGARLKTRAPVDIVGGAGDMNSAATRALPAEPDLVRHGR
jgi:hypothetical protein